ncbi:HAD family hydrolase [Streptomyces meridianus]|uniref:HAD family hydrolase n=1 Tax=Streptomyces meridianus TaxID=2938945 RepID=A0ABT0X9I7_9ACTN|nr:HAD family hydrolase [Streptomyces meridianus]MCM2578583.1 HAD family hydrolase [Streptomyces meridianus]
MNTCVLFDLDGTLLDTPRGIVRVLRDVIVESGRPLPPEEAIRATVGRPLAAVFSTLLDLPEDHAETAHAVERFRVVFREKVVPGAADLVFPGVPHLLSRLRDGGYPLAVVTSKIQASAEEILRPAGLRDDFDAVICHGMAARGKPHPDLALLAAERLDSDPACCVVVGDAVDDMRMARSAGMTAVGVTYGVATHAQLADAGAHHVTDSVDGLEAILGRLTAPERAQSPAGAVGGATVLEGRPTL